MTDSTRRDAPNATPGDRRSKFDSAGAYHLAGLAVTIGLIAVTVWIARAGSAEVTHITADDGMTVNLAEAAKILAEAEAWHRRHAVACDREKEVEQRVAAIRDWLPTQLEWPVAEQAIRSLAESNGLSLTMMGRQGRQLGRRVEVAAVTCRLRGPYEGICRFLAAAPDGGLPLACQHLVIERASAGGDGDSAESSLCDATMTLRIPYAAENSLGARLLSENIGIPEGENDAS